MILKSALLSPLVSSSQVFRYIAPSLPHYIDCDRLCDLISALYHTTYFLGVFEGVMHRESVHYTRECLASQ